MVGGDARAQRRSAVEGDRGVDPRTTAPPARPGAGTEAPTILDVAARAGVSRQTVSNVLNAPERVRPETRRRVEVAIDELGYHPSRSAQNLRARATRLLGYCVSPAPSGAINVVLDRFLHALTDAARDRGYQVLLFSTPTGEPELAAYDELLRAQAVDGFVVSETNYRDERIPFLLDRGVPFSVFGRTGLEVDHRWVDVDNADGTRQATEHLVRAGRRRIAYLGWPEGSITGDERVRGHRTALAAADLAFDPALDARGEDGVATGRAAADRWFALDDPPDGVVAASDLLAIGVLQSARARGLTVGDDLGVTGFDDTPTAAFLDPPLTSVRQPIEEVARHVVRQLVDGIAHGVAALDSALVAPRLIERDT